MNKNQKFLKLSNAIINQIEVMLKNTNNTVNSRIQHQDLENMCHKIKQMQNAVITNNLPPKDRRYSDLTRIINDQWPLGTELGNLIVELESYYKDL